MKTTELVFLETEICGREYIDHDGDAKERFARLLTDARAATDRDGEIRRVGIEIRPFEDEEALP